VIIAKESRSRNSGRRINGAPRERKLPGVKTRETARLRQTENNRRRYLRRRSRVQVLQEALRTSLPITLKRLRSRYHICRSPFLSLSLFTRVLSS